MPTTRIPASLPRPWPTLAEDIEAEFGARRTLPASYEAITSAQVAALHITFELASASLPSIMRPAFLCNATKRLKAHFGLEICEIPSDQFHEAIRVASQHIADSRDRFSNIVIELPNEDVRRWRLVHYDMAVISNGDVA